MEDCRYWCAVFACTSQTYTCKCCVTEPRWWRAANKSNKGKYRLHLSNGSENKTEQNGKENATHSPAQGIWYCQEILNGNTNRLQCERRSYWNSIFIFHQIFYSACMCVCVRPRENWSQNWFDCCATECSAAAAHQPLKFVNIEFTADQLNAVMTVGLRSIAKHLRVAE